MKKFFKVIGGLFSLLALLLLVLVLFLPQLINLKGIRKRIEKESSTRLHAQVQINELRLALIPRPGLRLKGLHIKAPKYSLEVPQAHLAFRLKPLIHKKLEIEGLHLQNPVLVINLGPKKGNLKVYLEAFKRLLTHVPLINLKAQGGLLRLEREHHPFFEIQRLFLRAEMRPDQVLIELQGQSPSFKALNLALKYWPTNDFVEGQLSVRHLDLAQLPLRKDKSWINRLHTDFSLESTFRREEDTWYMGFKATAPCLLKAQDPPLFFSCSALLGEARFSPQKKWVRLAQIVMQDPDLKGSAQLTLGQDKSFLFFKIKEGDFGAWRKRFSFLISKSKGLRHLFQIVQAGQVRNATLEFQGKTWRDFGHLQNITLSAEAQEAQINLPFLAAPLHVKRGQVRLYQKVLLVKDAQALYRDSQIQNARLELYLFDRTRPFLFEADLQVQAQHALEVLKRLLKAPKFQRIWTKVKDLKGQAQGHVKVAGSLAKPEVNFAVRPGEIYLLYQDFPLALTFRGGTWSYAQKKLAFQGAGLAFGQSDLQSLSGTIDLHQKPLNLDLQEARGRLVVKDLNIIWSHFGKLGPERLKSGVLLLKKASYQGELSAQALRKGLCLETGVKDLVVQVKQLPGDLKIQSGTARYEKGGLSFGPSEVFLLDAQGVVSGALNPLWGSARELSLAGKATLGPLFLDWLWQRALIPPALYPVAPLEARDLSFSLGKSLMLSAHLKTASGAQIDLNLKRDRRILRLNPVLVQVGPHRLRLDLVWKKGFFSFVWKGQLAKADWYRIFRKPWLSPSHLRANLKGTYYPHALTQSSFKGKLEVSGLDLKIRGLLLHITQLRAKGYGGRGEITELKARLDHTSFVTSGVWELAPRNLRFSGTLNAPEVDLQALQKIHLKPRPSSANPPWPPVVLDLDVRIPRLFWGRYTLTSVKANLLHFKKRWQIVLEKALFCGVNLVGGFDSSPTQKTLRLSYYRENGDLKKFLTCALGQDSLAEGVFNLEGTFQGKGPQNVLRDTAGKFIFSSPQGRLYKLGLLVKLFAFLNPLEVFQGNLPDLSKEGLKYDLLEIKGHFHKHYLVIDAAQIKATGLRIFASGKLDLLRKKIYLTALISPFVQADALVSHIPVVGWVLTGKSKTFFSIPVDIRGSLKEPEIIPLDPRAVSKTLLGILGRTLQLPVKLFIPEETPKKTPNAANPNAAKTKEKALPSGK